MQVDEVLPVEQEPEVLLVRWQVFEDETGAQFFVGLSFSTGNPRLSSQIESFDHDAMLGITVSGRIYQLVGPPAASDAVMQLINNLRLNGTLGTIRFVTKQYWEPDDEQ